ncbi:hypothetical protein Zm00014a_026349 [Zea mays]|uniref:Uncharacterized protein n=1 Tax=Zea mays TaxID=4577 RepID=A0A3L6EUV7_MAIZE|nr:hypothetical protein Zm00014a_026349 [Zea mays]
MPPWKPLAGGKLKKPLTDKQRAAAEQRLSHLRAHLILRSLDSPAGGARSLPPPQEAALDALGLLIFFRLDLQSGAPRPDLIAPLVAYYDPVCKRSFVRGVRVGVSRHHIIRALCLPSKPASAAPAPADVDPAAVVAAVMQLLQDYVLLPFQGDDRCILPQQVAAAEQMVREGAAHRVDWGELIWGLVEKEMLELPKREDWVCYYGPHLQRLIYAQKPHLLELVEEGPVQEPSANVDLKRKSMVELEQGDGDREAGNNVKSKSLNDSESGKAGARNDGLDELELADAVTRNKVMGELGLGDVDARKNSIVKLEVVDEDARCKCLNEIQAVDAINNNIVELDAANEDARCKSLNDESEPVEEDVKGPSFDDMNTVDEHVDGTNTDGSCLGFVAVEAVPAVNVEPDVVPDYPVIPTASPTNIKRLKTFHKPSTNTKSNIGQNFSRLLEEHPKIAYDICNGPINMYKCTKKLLECGFTGKVLHIAIKILKEDWEARQIFMALDRSESVTFISNAVGDYS